MKYQDILVETFEIKAPTGEIVNGQKGAWVADVQKALTALNYTVGNSGPNKDGIDGLMGPRTMDALQQFAKDEGLADLGELTDELIFVLDDTIREKGLDKKLKPENELNYNTSTGQGRYEKVAAREVYNYIRERGLSKFHALGMLSNIQAESSFNPSAIGDNGTSAGLFQHHKTRWQNLKEFAKRRGTQWTDWKTQVDFALSEPAGQQYAAMNFKSAAEASIWFTKYFEIPANKEQQAAIRVNNLNNYNFA